jgi:subtilisin family serine protease
MPRRDLRRRAVGIRALPQHLTITGALALSLCLLALLAAGSGQAYALVEDYKSGQVIVKLADEHAIEEIDNIHEDVPGYKIIDDSFASKRIYLLKPPLDYPGTEEEFANLLETEGPTVVDYAEPNFVADTPENDTVGDGRHRAWGESSTFEGDKRTPSDRDATEALGLGCAARISQGRGITVAVLDTGAQLRHPALETNWTEGYDFVGKGDQNPSDRMVGLDVDRDEKPDELYGHGTHVAGIVDRVAPAAKIMPLRVLNSEGYGDAYTTAKAIAYAQRHEVDVINLSLGTSRFSELLYEMVTRATGDNIAVAAAAGNSNTEDEHYPAAGASGTQHASPLLDPTKDGLLAVTSVNRYGKKSGFANFGLWVDIAAPGQDIRSAFPTSVYRNWSGTSMATPFVSGQAALIRKVYGRDRLDPAGIETKIREAADDSIYDPLTYDPEYLATYAGKLGAGHANVCASIKK